MFEVRPVTSERAAKAGKADELEGDVGCSSLPHLTLETSETGCGNRWASVLVQPGDSYVPFGKLVEK